MNSNLHTVILKSPSTRGVGNGRFANAPLLLVNGLLLGSSALLGSGTLVGCGADARETEPSGSRLIDGVVLIDDGEDGDNALIPEDEAGYLGYWYTYDDRQECDNPEFPDMGVVCGSKVCAASGLTSPLPDPQGGPGFTMTSYSAASAPPAPPEGDQEENTMGIRVTGGGNVSFGSGLGVGLNNPGSPQAYDMTVPGFTTVRFLARTATPGTQMKVKIKDAYSEPLGGICLERENLCDDVSSLTCTCGGAMTQGCHNDPAHTLGTDPRWPALSDTWLLYEIPLSVLARGSGWGAYIPGMEPPDGMLDLTRAFQLQFEIMRPMTETNLPPFEVWLDNVGFGTGEPPPPTPGAAPSGT